MQKFAKFERPRKLNEHCFAWDFSLTVDVDSYLAYLDSVLDPNGIECHISVLYEDGEWWIAFRGVHVVICKNTTEEPTNLDYRLSIHNNREEEIIVWIPRIQKTISQNLYQQYISQRYPVSLSPDLKNASEVFHMILHASDVFHFILQNEGQYVLKLSFIPQASTETIDPEVSEGQAKEGGNGYEVSTDTKDPEIIQGQAKDDGNESDGLEKFSEDMKLLLSEDEGCDVTFRVKDREFKAHQPILKARSPVFKRMLQHDMIERQSGLVQITDCEPDAFEHFLRYLYSGKADIDFGNVAELYHISDKYEVTILSQNCVDFMKGNFAVDSFCDFATIAFELHDCEFLASATSFLAKNFKGILSSEKWMDFMRKNSFIANELIMMAHK